MSKIPENEWCDNHGKRGVAVDIEKQREHESILRSINSPDYLSRDYFWINIREIIHRRGEVALRYRQSKNDDLKEAYLRCWREHNNLLKELLSI